jgi:predicted nucleotide-binding protein
LAKSERNHEQIIDALAALQSHVRDTEPAIVVRDYHELLDRLAELTNGIPPEFRVPSDDLSRIPYAVDADGNVTSESELRYIERSRLLARLNPALEFAREAPSVTIESDSSPSTASKASPLFVERRQARWESMSTVDELDLVARELRALRERIGIITIPPASRERLETWVQVIEDGRLSVEDWQQMREDVEDLSSHISENVERDPDDYGSIVIAHQSLVSYPDAITSIMSEIEIRETTNLGKTLEAFGKRQQRRRARAAELKAVRGTVVAVMPAEVANAVNAEPSTRDTPVVFIGHGHSPLWRELKDYIEDDLQLDTKYFEQDSRVGMHMAEVLSGFLDQATCAIVVLTADDEQADGRERARQNVVHEVGYFQGKLGFKRVAMVIQDGVERFSNVDGIVPVRFPARQIKQAFPELQRWLKREGMIP